VSQITTHVLDTAIGTTGGRRRRHLSRKRRGAGSSSPPAHQRRRPRRRTCWSGHPLPAGTYRMHFATGATSTQRQRGGLLPFVDVVFVWPAMGRALPHSPAALALRLLDLPRQLSRTVVRVAALEPLTAEAFAPSAMSSTRTAPCERFPSTRAAPAPPRAGAGRAARRGRRGGDQPVPRQPVDAASFCAPGAPSPGIAGVYQYQRQPLRGRRGAPGDSTSGDSRLSSPPRPERELSPRHLASLPAGPGGALGLRGDRSRRPRRQLRRAGPGGAAHPGSGMSRQPAPRRAAALFSTIRPRCRRGQLRLPRGRRAAGGGWPRDRRGDGDVSPPRRRRDTPQRVTPGRAAVPGFIDTHVHYPQLDIVGAHGEQLLEWLDRYVFPTEARFADRTYARGVARRFLASCCATARPRPWCSAPCIRSPSTPFRGGAAPLNCA
jgi:5-hydroxyisourate hydrolase-like protein (transthyretin family)